MKYKVLMADDEEEVLQSICRKLDWESYGFEVAGTFLNGRDVMEYLETQEADLVITDIRMPFMDGIEVAKKISEDYPQTKVMIVSGYGDFNYAKEAMTYHVSDYILKPVNAKEMGEVLQRARETLDREREEKKSIQFLKKQYAENLPIIRESFLNQLISGNVQREELSERLENCGLSLSRAACWATVLIQTDKFEQRQEGEKIDRQYISVYIQNLIRERFHKEYNYAVFYSHLGECMIFGLEEPGQIRKILLRLNSIARESSRAAGICPAIGVGRIKKDLLEARASFEEAREALMYRRMTRDSSVIYIEDIDISRHDYVFLDEQAKEMFFSAVKFGDSTDIRLVLRDFYSDLKSRNISWNGWQSWSVSMMNALLLFSRQYPSAMDKIFGGKLDCVKILNQYPDMDAFFGWLERESLRVGTYFEQERISRNRSIIDSPIQYRRQRK